MGCITKISRVFRRLCAKVAHPTSKEQLLADTTECMCSFERLLPPAIFDIMVHLTIHLVEELFICRPVHTRWMYPYERYYKGMKGQVRNLAKPKGSLATGYQLEEALGYITEYMSSYDPTSRRVWDDDKEASMTDEILQGKGKPRMLSDQELLWMHGFVGDNATALEPYRT